jgi:hypothetical protein
MTVLMPEKWISIASQKPTSTARRMPGRSRSRQARRWVRSEAVISVMANSALARPPMRSMMA